MPRSLPIPSPEAIAVLCLCALLVLLDASVVSFSYVGLAVVASGVVALGAAAAQLRLYRFGRQWTACALSAVVATVSLLATSLVQGTVLQRTPGWAELLGLLVLLCLACRYGRPVPLVLSAVPLFVAVVWIEGRAPALSNLPVLKDIDGLFTLLPVAFVLLGGYLRTEDGRRRIAAENVRQAERLDLARDLHDHVAHYVTAMVVQAQAGEHTAERDPATARKLFANIEQTGQEGLVAMSRMVRLLREADGAVAEAPVTPAMTRIEELVHQFTGIGQHAWLDIADDVDGAVWSPQLAKSVERLVQEGLTNIRKHARTATTVHVKLGTDGDRLVVRVRDNAIGQQRGRVWFRPSGFGMIGLSERVAELGGELSSGPMPEGGWELAASIPMK
ncbi:sensor histidine kinase [Streptantibioticus rubrisoli]|uniref:histidine kinase n=1 Tax=Streptantibioticus rubrisoli TaxID=1387313 RepID=A0ABT1PIF7_9ACTN|nr:histidine kinase [Streptantibioticus rubrisoli]MCQ4045145.1 histidine kinase [Streptantibioticus rubrisoli]